MGTSCLNLLAWSDHHKTRETANTTNYRLISIESQPKKVVVIAVLDLGQVVAFGVVVVVVVVINVSPRNLPLKFGQNQVSNS